MHTVSPHKYITTCFHSSRNSDVPRFVNKPISVGILPDIEVLSIFNASFPGETYANTIRAVSYAAWRSAHIVSSIVFYLRKLDKVQSPLGIVPSMPRRFEKRKAPVCWKN